MSDYSKEYQKRKAANAKGIKHLSPDQFAAVLEAKQALREFMQEWTESFDLYNPETPRKLQTAFWKMNNAFEFSDD